MATTVVDVAGAVPVPAGAVASRLPNVIYEGDTVICQTSDGRMFFQEMKKDQCVVFTLASPVTMTRCAMH